MNTKNKLKENKENIFFVLEMFIGLCIFSGLLTTGLFLLELSIEGRLDIYMGFFLSIFVVVFGGFLAVLFVKTRRRKYLKKSEIKEE